MRRNGLVWGLTILSLMCTSGCIAKTRYTNKDIAPVAIGTSPGPQTADRARLYFANESLPVTLKNVTTDSTQVCGAEARTDIRICADYSAMTRLDLGEQGHRAVTTDEALAVPFFLPFTVLISAYAVGYEVVTPEDSKPPSPRERAERRLAHLEAQGLIYRVDK